MALKKKIQWFLVSMGIVIIELYPRNLESFLKYF